MSDSAAIPDCIIQFSSNAVEMRSEIENTEN